MVLFEFGGKDLLGAGIPTIDEIRPAIAFMYFVAGSRQADQGPGVGRSHGTR